MATIEMPGHSPMPFADVDPEEAAPAAVRIPAERSADVARSGVYALFAQLFGFPHYETLERLADERWLVELSELVGQLPFTLDVVEPVEPSASSDQHREISLTFSRLFDVVHGMPTVSLLERRYGENVSQKKLWEDLLRYYNHFGLEFAESAAEGGPDHLVSQLEFIHYLSFLQCGSGDAGGDLRRAQRDFLTHHLGKWSSDFAQRTQAEADSQPYSRVADLMADFVAADLAYLQTECDGLIVSPAT